jgi:cytochrome c oxidase subunit II
MVWRGRLTRWGLAPLLLVLSAVIFGGCDSKTPNILDPAGPVAKTQSDLFWIILSIATVIFVIVTGVLVYSIIRFRDRPGAPEPRQTSGNTKLEIAWTIAPSLVLFLVLIFTISYMYKLAQPAAASSSVVHVEAIGHQWWWEFHYTDASPVVVTGDELHVPVGTIVHVDLSSDNVIHSFWIPQLSGKTDVIPGHSNFLWFQADKVGQYRGECAEYCGVQHANMDFVVVADPPNQFQAWLTAQQASALAPVTAAQKAGQQNFLHLGCVACHTIAGLPANGKIGPNLTHFGGRLLIAGGVLSNTNQNLTTWLNDPQAVKPGNDMVIPHLSQQQVSDLVAYLESLK